MATGYEVETYHNIGRIAFALEAIVAELKRLADTQERLVAVTENRRFR